MLKALFTGVAAGVTYLDCVGYIARVDGLSMQPTLNPCDVSPDYVYLSRWCIRNFSVARGDIVSITSPRDPEQRIIKRIIALQGDVVFTMSSKAPVVKVPDGHCWVEGDHTALSLDSNYFGPVPVGLMTAKATHIVWPPERWQKLRSDIPKSRSSKTSSNQRKI